MGRARAAKPRYTPEDHRQQVAAVHGNRIQPVGDYVGAHTKIKYRCPTHGIFEAKPANVIHRRSGCARCYHESHIGRDRKSSVTYAKEAGALGVEVLDDYETSHVPIRHRCAKGHVWVTSPNQLLSGYGCPLCDRSQYRRRPITVGKRQVMVQGAEGRAVEILLSEGISPTDLAFTSGEGRPTFRYAFAGRRDRTYVPDIFDRSTNTVIEVKSPVTLGVYDKRLFGQVCVKAKAVARAGYQVRLMLIHRGRNYDLGPDWFDKTWSAVRRKFKEMAHARDLRYRRK